jgi:hypothetical protein
LTQEETRLFEAFIKKDNQINAPFKEWLPWWGVSTTTQKPSNIDIQEVVSLSNDQESVNLNSFLEYIDERKNVGDESEYMDLEIIDFAKIEEKTALMANKYKII